MDQFGAQNKKKRNPKNLPVIVLSILAVGTLIFGVAFTYFYYGGALVSPAEKVKRPVIENILVAVEDEGIKTIPPELPDEEEIEGEFVEEETEEEEIEYEKVEIEEEYLDYILFKFEAYQLRNIPFSENNPIIVLEIDGRPYTTEIIDNKIITKRGDTENEDVRIITTKKIIIDSLISDSVQNVIKKSVNEGETSLEIKSGKGELLVKGYLSLYEKFTGEDVGDIAFSPTEGRFYLNIVVALIIIIVLIIYFWKRKK